MLKLKIGELREYVRKNIILKRDTEPCIKHTIRRKSGGSGAKFSRRTILLFIFMFNSELYLTKPWKIQ